MIVVDTNIISEVMRPQPAAAVLSWLNAQDGNRLFITTVTLAEIGYGLRILPEGQRRWQLQSRFEQLSRKRSRSGCWPLLPLPPVPMPRSWGIARK